MGLKDFLNAGKIRKENEGLKELINPELQDAAKLNEHIAELEIKKEKLEKELQLLTDSVERRKKDVVFFNDALVYQDFGLYTPRYDFLTSDEYKQKLEQIRSKQKEMIKNDKAIAGAKTWSVDGSQAKGRSMIKNMKKLFLRAFNSDCEDVISKVKYSNYDMSVKKINQSANSIEKLGKMMALYITMPYLQSKLDELQLAFEYQVKKEKKKKLKRPPELNCERLLVCKKN